MQDGESAMNIARLIEQLSKLKYHGIV